MLDSLPNANKAMDNASDCAQAFLQRAASCFLCTGRYACQLSIVISAGNFMEVIL